MKYIGLFVLLCSCTLSDDSKIADCCYYLPYVSNYFDYESKTIQIETALTTNGGAPLYLLIKRTDFNQFLLDDYSSIAQGEEETECLAWLCLMPGEKRTLKIDPPEGPIAFYALFTDPKTDWKWMITPGQEFKQINVCLGEQEISAITLEGLP